MPPNNMPQAMIPTPDPTKLTTDAVDKAKIELKELFDTKLDGFVALVNEKFAGQVAALEAIKDFSEQLNKSNTTAIDKAEISTTKQIDSQAARIDELKEGITKLEGRNWSVVWSTVGAYIIGAVGIASFIAVALMRK